MPAKLHSQPAKGLRLSPDKFGLVGSFTIEHERDGKILRRETVRNTIVDVGKDKILDVMFYAATQITNWYIGLIMDGSYTGIAAGDTMGSHAGWAEFTDYSQSTRPEWAPDAASGQAITNSTARTFSITGGDTLKGIFVASSSTKSGTTGTLWAATLFSSDYSVNNGDTLRIIYNVEIS